MKITLPMQRSKKFYTVLASINGQEPVRLLLDTGLDVRLILDLNCVQDIGIDVEGSTNQLMTSKLPLYLCHARAIRLLGKRDNDLLLFNSYPSSKQTRPLRRIAFYAADLKSVFFRDAYPNFEGIMGINTIASGIFSIDFQQKIATYDKAPYKPRRKCVVLPICWQAGDTRVFVPVSLPNGEIVNCLVDTAAQFSSIPKEMLIANSKSPLTSARIQIWGCIYDAQQGTLPKIKLGDFTIKNVRMCSDDSDRIYVLGLNVLSRFRVTIDYKRSVVYFEKRWLSNLFRFLS